MGGRAHGGPGGPVLITGAAGRLAAEVVPAFERAGFAVEAVYADYDRSPYGSKYPGELIFVARKR